MAHNLRLQFDRFLSASFFQFETLVGLIRRLLQTGKKGSQRASRFVRFSERRYGADFGMSGQFFHATQMAKDRKRRDAPDVFVHWKGVNNVKDPFSLSVYPLLLWELRPATIIEVGAFDGGSAYWMADLLDSMEIDCHIYSYDISIKAVVVEHPKVTFIQADSNKPETFDPSRLEHLPHPWLIIEDAHVNVYQLLKFFNRFMQSGDYLIVEDTLPYKKYREFARFAEEFDDNFRVDTGYTDIFGYNVGWGINNFLKKMA